LFATKPHSKKECSLFEIQKRQMLLPYLEEWEMESREQIKYVPTVLPFTNK